MRCDAVLLSVFWDADSLFRLASTKLTEVQSATRAIIQLASLGLVKVVTIVDAVNAAHNALRRVYGRRSAGMVRKLRKLLQVNFHIVPTPAPERVQVSELGNRRIGETENWRLGRGLIPDGC